MRHAKAVFIICKSFITINWLIEKNNIILYFNISTASRGINKDLADQHSILRSWAIKDYAPQTPQFVQLFRPDNMINIKFAGNYFIFYLNSLYLYFICWWVIII